MTNDINYRLTKSASDWALGKALSKNFSIYRQYKIGRRVAYILKSNYEIYSLYGCTEETAFDYTLMNLFSPIVNEENLPILRKISEELTQREIKNDLAKSKIFKKLAQARKQHWLR